MSAPGLILAAPSTGSGKTTVTLGLLAALRRQGMRVASAKVGPDYIDPAFHARASGRPCLNLDGWAMRPATLAGLAGEAAAQADLLIVEGVMGLFDGARVTEGPDGSTADLAGRLSWPVVLVIDAGGLAGSAAAILKGFAGFEAKVRVVGVIFNRVGGAEHTAILADACRRACPDIAILGGLPRQADLELPSRHLGLVQAVEHADLERMLARAADWIAAHLDLERLVGLAKPGPTRASSSIVAIPPLGQRIALARDEAFAFAYPALLEGWRRAGAEIHPFSPLADQAPDAGADAVYLPGGYPELQAARLAGNRRFLDGLRERVQAGAAILGECGGYMVLGQSLIDAEGQAQPMAGLLPLVASFAQRKLHLGYRQAVLATDTPLGARGMGFRGHEFHYATILEEGAGTPLFAASDAAGRPKGDAGRMMGRVMGSFIHLIDRE
ncbi:MAG: cobyrinate a,c-diamide synthase [Rhodospirillales bacterium]|nr:cobyrinate a,c-diamide synthase [Rhodospirillales bacterium]